MPKIVLFDFDGVLADTLTDMLRFAGEACAELGYPCLPTAGDLDALETMSFDHYGRQLGLPEKKVKEFTQLCLERFNARAEPPAIFPGMAEVLRELSGSYRIGIVTGNTAQAVRRFLEWHGLDGMVRVIVDVAQPGTRADKIARAAGEIGNGGEEVYFVGDAVSDVHAAAQASAKSIAVAWGHQSSRRLEAAGADYLVQEPTDLPRILDPLQSGEPGMLGLGAASV